MNVTMYPFGVEPSVFLTLAKETISPSIFFKLKSVAMSPTERPSAVVLLATVLAVGVVVAGSVDVCSALPEQAVIKAMMANLSNPSNFFMIEDLTVNGCRLPIARRDVQVIRVHPTRTPRRATGNLQRATDIYKQQRYKNVAVKRLQVAGHERVFL